MGPPGRSSTSCRASRADGGPAGAGLGPGGPGPAGGRPMPGWRIRMEDRKCGHPAPLQSTKARYQVLRRRPSRSRRAPSRPRRSRRCDSDANRCRARVRRRRCDHAPSGYPHRRWNCLRRCSRPPTSAWRDGSASWWRCPLAPSGSTGAPAGADPPDPPPPARCPPQSPGRSARSEGRSRSRPLSLVVHLGSETAVTDWALDGSVHAKQQSRPTVLLVVPSARLKRRPRGARLRQHSYRGSGGQQRGASVESGF